MSAAELARELDRQNRLMWAQLNREDFYRIFVRTTVRPVIVIVTVQDTGEETA